MAKTSKLESLIRSWYPKETVITNTRSVLPSKREIDLYFPKYKVGVEVNGAFWHSEASGRDKYYHQKKCNEAASVGVSLLSFYDFHIKEEPNYVKNVIDRETFQKFLLNEKFSKVAEFSLDGVSLLSKHNDLDKEYCNRYGWLLLKDRKGICAGITCSEEEHLIQIMDYFERKDVHPINGFAKLVDAVRLGYKKPIVVSTCCDRGLFTPHSLTRKGYRQLFQTEPLFYWIQGSKKLPWDTKEDTTGWSRVFDSGKILLAHESQYDQVLNILEPKLDNPK